MREEESDFLKTRAKKKRLRVRVRGHMGNRTVHMREAAWTIWRIAQLGICLGWPCAPLLTRMRRRTIDVAFTILG